MKLLAILGDSFREATDARVLYLLLALSAGLTFTFASLTFTPRPARELLAGNSRATLEQPLGTAANDTEASFSLRAVEPLDGAPDGPRSPLRFLVRAQFIDVHDAEQARRDPARIEDFLRQHFGRYGGAPGFRVVDVRPAPPGGPVPNGRQVYFELTTRATGDTLRLWPHDSSLLFGALPLAGMWQFLEEAGSPGQSQAEVPPLGFQVLTFEELLVNGLGSWGAVLASIFVTAFFVPNMLHKGAVDLLLVKPLPRWRLLVYKYLGGLVFIALNATLAVGGVWLVLGLRSGVWCHALLLLVPILTFGFAVLYAVSVLTSVLTHSPVVSILITCLVWALFYGVGWTHAHLHGEVPGARLVLPADRTGQAVVATVDALHSVLPRTEDLDELTSRLLERDLFPLLREPGVEPVEGGPHWSSSLGFSGLFIAVMLGLACLRFSTKDY